MLSKWARGRPRSSSPAMLSRLALLCLATATPPMVLADSSSSDSAYPLTTDGNCTCYFTNSTTADYFSHHSFFDFRSLAEYAGTPDVLTDSQASTDAGVTSDYFSADAFASMWQPANWNNSEQIALNDSDVSGSDATLLMVNSFNNIYIDLNNDSDAAADATFLVMRTARVGDAFQTAAEMESASNGFRYLSVRMLARTRGASGAVTAMFTYREPASGASQVDVQESDLEILTRGPDTRVQLTNQPSWNDTGDIPAATRNVSLPDGAAWTDWATYRMDWTPGATSWYVNGQLADTITFQAPRDASQLVFNSWSDGGSWSGNMSAHAQAFLDIQWIDMVFNNTDKTYHAPSGACDAVCSIDDTNVTGTPVLLASASTRPRPSLVAVLALSLLAVAGLELLSAVAS